MQENDKEGFVYVLSNKSMPGLLKIGYSKNVSERVKQLSNTSIPTPFKCEYYIYSENCAKLEKMVHLALSMYRVNDDREFFKLSLINAIKCIYVETTQLNKDYHNSIWGLRDLLGCKERLIDEYEIAFAKNQVELLEKQQEIKSLNSDIGTLLLLLNHLSPGKYVEALKSIGREDILQVYLKRYKNNFRGDFYND